MLAQLRLDLLRTDPDGYSQERIKYFHAMCGPRSPRHLGRTSSQGADKALYSRSLPRPRVTSLGQSRSLESCRYHPVPKWGEEPRHLPSPEGSGYSMYSSHLLRPRPHRYVLGCFVIRHEVVHTNSRDPPGTKIYKLRSRWGRKGSIRRHLFPPCVLLLSVLWNPNDSARIFPTVPSRCS